MPYNPDNHQRRSIRLPGYDYAQTGAYFVTICTYDRANTLGKLTDKAVVLSPLGWVVARCWVELPQRFPYLTLDSWVIMPDHFHSIVHLRGLQPIEPQQTHQRPCGTRPNSLSAVVQSFKSLSTRRAHILGLSLGCSLWQRNFYERIIRNEAELVATQRYIVQNPERACIRRGRS